MAFQYQGYSNKLYTGDWITAYSDVKSNYNGYDIGVTLLISALGDKQTRVSLNKLTPTKTLSVQNKLAKVKDQVLLSEKKVKVCGVEVYVYIEYIIRDDTGVYVEIVGLGSI